MPSHYGGFWDFTSDMKHQDTAYTPLPLGAHTDTTYYGQSAGLQLFHCLKQSETGGESLLVDGYRAAQILRTEHLDSYRILSRTPVPSHSAGDPNYFFQVTSKPVLCHDLVGTGELIQVRWNNDDRSAMNEFPHEHGVDGFYEAIRRWDEILRRKDSEYWFQLVPGRAVIFDNWRVLHGRNSFVGERRLCGAYISRDAFKSRFLTTNVEREKLLMEI